MRITCPNCAAQYDVEAAEVPPSGRDLICSACGHAWFHGPAEVEGQAAPPPDDGEDPAFEDADPGEAPQPTPPPLDPSLRALLRAEAEREADARKAEAAARPQRPAQEASAPTGAEPRPAAEAKSGDLKADPSATVPPATPPADTPTAAAPGTDTATADVETDAAQAGPATPDTPRPLVRQPRTAQPAPPRDDAAPEHRPRGRALLPAVEDITPSAPGTAAPRPAAHPAPATARPRRRRAGLALATVLGAMLAAAGLYVHTRNTEAPPGAMVAYADWVDRRQTDLSAAVAAARDRLDAALQGQD